MANTTVLVFSVNPVTGANSAILGVELADAQGKFSIRLAPVPSGPLRLLADGGTFVSEMNGATVFQPTDIAALLPSASSNIAGISINPLTDFVNSLTVGKLRIAGTTFASAYGSAVATIESLYALTGDPARILPSYAPAAVGSNAGNLGLVLGALINEDQSLCPSWPGGLVAALSTDIADGVFDARYFGAPIAYCGRQLRAIAGTAAFQDALAGISQLALITRAFGFGGAGNLLTANGLANLALGGNQRYPLGPLAAIDAGIVKAAPKAQNVFALPGATAKMNSGHAFATATLLPSGKVLIAGGVDLAILASTELYDPASNTFAARTVPMNSPRENATAILLSNGKVLIAGGDLGLASPFSSTELYDPATNTFARKTPFMNVARTLATATLLPSGKVLIAGGFASGKVASASTELFDPATNTFAFKTAPMNIGREGANATLLPNGKVLIAGGMNVKHTPLGSTELYDPAINAFAPPAGTATMKVARVNATAALLSNGKVLIAGGYSGAALFTTELYDPATNTFASPPGVASMNLPRSGATATLLPNGKVLIAGGFDAESNQIASTELYDPATNTFAPPIGTATMKVARGFDTATLLPNGKVLIAGGGNLLGIPTFSSTEIYTP